MLDKSHAGKGQDSAVDRAAPVSAMPSCRLHAKRPAGDDHIAMATARIEICDCLHKPSFQHCRTLIVWLVHAQALCGKAPWDGALRAMRQLSSERFKRHART